LKRLAFLLIWIALLCLSAAPIRAQDQPPPTEPTPESGLDTVTGTPIPLPTRGARPASYLVAETERAQLHFFFQALPQGTTALMRVVGDEIANARALFLGDLIDFFPADDALYGLIAAGMEQATGRSHALAVYLTFTDGTRATLETTVEIVLGSFIRQQVTLAPDKGYLLDTETEQNELARLESIISGYTTERYWDETGFGLPIPAALTSPFGAYRTFNGTINTRHTGWDIRTTLGQPVFAAAAGRVVFAGTLPIRGSYVVIDHGYGVFTGYAHFSTTHVTRGEVVAKGQVLGTTGDSGRTSGPHFHWELAVNGDWVDSVQFLELWMP
jgi:murein DD-endopeptidase MepM/ murein hydrolase activator NlpD